MWQARVLVAAAIVAGMLYLAGAIALGSAPTVTQTPVHVMGWFRDHHQDARIYAWTATLGTLAFAVTAGIIRETLPAPNGSVFAIGATAFIVETAIQAWCWAALALHPGALAPGTAALVLDVARFWGPVLTGATTTMIAAVTVLGVGPNRSIPGWLAVLGAIALTEQLVETITVFGTHGFIAPGGAMNLLLGAVLTAIWLAGVVIWTAPRLARSAHAG